MTKKVQLNLHAKTLLLKYRMLVPKQAMSGYANDLDHDPASRCKLVKFLSISKRFLHLSQREQIYDFSFLSYSKGVNLGTIEFKCAFQKWHNHKFNLSFEKIQILIHFLKPRMIWANFNNIRGYAAVKQCKELLESTSGKINLDGHVYPTAIIRFLIENPGRIFNLSCSADLLSEENSFIPRLQLNTCRLFCLESYDQLNVILQNHDIKMLHLYLPDWIDHDTFTFDDYDSFSKASTLTNLQLYHAEYDSLIFKKTSKLVEFFPNLKLLKYELDSGYKEKMFDNSTLCEKIINFYDDCRSIQNACPLDAKLEFSLKQSFKIYDLKDFTTEWHAQLKQHPAFIDSKDVKTLSRGSIKFYRFAHSIVEENFDFSIKIDVPYPLEPYDGEPFAFNGNLFGNQ